MRFSILSAGNQNVIFEATGFENTTGGFVDTVTLVKALELPSNENVPEPGTYALVGAALAGVGLLRSKRQNTVSEEEKGARPGWMGPFWGCG